MLLLQHDLAVLSIQFSIQVRFRALGIRRMLKTLLLTFFAGSVALVMDWAIAAAAPRFTNVPQDFPPFTLLPILSGTFGGAILASLAYSILKVFAKNPDRIFFFAAASALAISFSLPLRLSFTKSPRFAGVTTSAQMVLILMHTIVATVSVVVLLSKQEL